MLVPDLGDLLVFPCGPDKKPLIDAWPENAKRVEPPGHWPLVGSITGPRNGYDVLDVECEGLAWLEANPIRRTRAHRTPRGWHLLFRAAEGLSGSNDLRISKDVHVRATGSYHIWWPRQGYAVVDAPLAEWPEELLRLAMGHHAASSGPAHIDRAVSNCGAVSNCQGLSAADTICKLDPTEFREYTKWLHLMMACHAAGIEREAFVEWSAGDPLYAGAGEGIRRMWNALKAGGNANGRIGEATLFAAIRDAGSKEQPGRCVSVPSPPKKRRQMGWPERNELSRMLRWLASQKEDEGALFWIACRLGEWRMKFHTVDRVLEELLLGAAWQAGLRDKDRVRSQVRNGLRIGALEWLDRHANGHADGGGQADIERAVSECNEQPTEE
jgi:hypothetical protein